MSMVVLTALLTCSLLLAGGTAVSAQTPPQQPPPATTGKPEVTPQTTPSGTVELVDVFDLLRKLRHKEQTEAERADSLNLLARMYAFTPVVGYKTSSGFLVGAAGNMAGFFGDPATTRISSAVLSATISSKNQKSLTVKFGRFSRNNRWLIGGDNRFLWTSQDTFGLGTDTAPEDVINQKFDYFRVYETAFRQLWRGVFGGIGFHYGIHRNVEPGVDADALWDTSPFVTYSERYGFPLASQTSAGTSVNLAIDTRDSTINPDRGWLAGASYRTFFAGFLGGDSTWQELYVDMRTYRKLSRDARHKLAFWVFGDFVTGGVAPYLDLPATGMDTYGRTGRGYIEGRFRGERLMYGEVEYRATLTNNGLLGMVVFANTTTVSDSQDGERLFDRFANAGGVGLRLLINKRSKTNLCFDVGWGRQGSRAIFVAVQEAF